MCFDLIGTIINQGCVTLCGHVQQILWKVDIDSVNLWTSSESCLFIHFDLDLGFDIIDQRQDRQNICMCSADTSKAESCVQHTNFDHVYTCFDLDLGEMMLDRGNDIF